MQTNSDNQEDSDAESPTKDTLTPDKPAKPVYRIDSYNPLKIFYQQQLSLFH